MDNQSEDGTAKENATKPRKVRNPIGGSRPLELTPEMFEHAGRCALTWKHVAGVLGVSFGTVQDRMKDPAFREAYDRGKLNSQTEVIQFLFGQMRGGSVKAGIFLAQAWCHLSTRHEVKSEETHTTKYVVEVPPDAPTLNDWTYLHGAANGADKSERIN